MRARAAELGMATPTNLSRFVATWHANVSSGVLVPRPSTGRPSAAAGIVPLLLEYQALAEKGRKVRGKAQRVAYRRHQLKLQRDALLAAAPKLSKRGLRRALHKYCPKLRTVKVHTKKVVMYKPLRRKLARERLAATYSHEQIFIVDETTLYTSEAVGAKDDAVVVRGSAVAEATQYPVEDGRLNSPPIKVCAMAMVSGAAGAGPLEYLTGTTGHVSKYQASTDGACIVLAHASLACSAQHINPLASISMCQPHNAVARTRTQQGIVKRKVLCGLLRVLIAVKLHSPHAQRAMHARNQHVHRAAAAREGPPLGGEKKTSAKSQLAHGIPVLFELAWPAPPAHTPG